MAYKFQLGTAVNLVVLLRLTGDMSGTSLDADALTVTNVGTSG